MAFTEKDRIEQQKAFDEVKDEFSRLTAQLDAALKEGGLSREDLQQALNEKRAPEVEAYMAHARDAAVRAGEARAAQVSAGGRKASSAPGRGRPNVVRL